MGTRIHLVTRPTANGLVESIRVLPKMTVECCCSCHSFVGRVSFLRPQQLNLQDACISWVRITAIACWIIRIHNTHYNASLFRIKFQTAYFMIFCVHILAILLDRITFCCNPIVR